MAGFVIRDWDQRDCVFHIDDPDVAGKIREATDGRRVLMLQLDGDELDAALWGFENYRKGVHHV